NLKDQEYLENNFIIMCTKRGTIKKTSLEAYSRPRANGINAININEGDQLLEACLTDGSSEIVMALKSGRAIRFNESTVRPMGRTATGVRGISLTGPDDEVVGMISVNNYETTVLVVSEKGYGKRTDIEDYRVTNRGGKGVKTINVTDKTGKLVAIKDVTDNDDLMIINKSGIVIRIAASELRVMGRATQGVRLISLKGDDEIASITKVEREDEEDFIEEGENQEHSENTGENDEGKPNRPNGNFYPIGSWHNARSGSVQPERRELQLCALHANQVFQAAGSGTKVCRRCVPNEKGLDKFQEHSPTRTRLQYVGCGRFKPHAKVFGRPQRYRAVCTETTDQ